MTISCSYLNEHSAADYDVIECRIGSLLSQAEIISLDDKNTWLKQIPTQIDYLATSHLSPTQSQSNPIENCCSTIVSLGLLVDNQKVIFSHQPFGAITQ